LIEVVCLQVLHHNKLNRVAKAVYVPLGALRVSSKDHEPNVRSIPQSWGGHKFDSLDPIKVRLYNQGRRFTPFTIHLSCESTRRVFCKVFLGKRKDVPLEVYESFNKLCS